MLVISSSIFPELKTCFQIPVFGKNSLLFYNEPVSRICLMTSPDLIKVPL